MRNALSIEQAKEAKLSIQGRRKKLHGIGRGNHPNSKAAARRNKARPFPKGMSGNPGGLPGYDVSAVLSRRVFAENQEQIAAGMKKRLCAGEPYAFSVFADRGFGKVANKVELGTVDDKPLQIAIKLVKPAGDVAAD